MTAVEAREAMPNSTSSRVLEFMRILYYCIRESAYKSLDVIALEYSCGQIAYIERERIIGKLHEDGFSVETSMTKEFIKYTISW